MINSPKPTAKRYSDVSRAFTLHPLSQDVTSTTNEASIRESIINIILTNPQERPYSNMGAGIQQLLFDPIDHETTLALQNMIESSVLTYEPRVQLLQVSVIPDEERNAYDIGITFSPINNTQQFNFRVTLKRLR